MRLQAEIDGKMHDVQIEGNVSKPSLTLDGRPLTIDARAMEGFFLSLLVGGKAYEVTVEPETDGWRVQVGIEAHRVTFIDPLRPARSADGAAGQAGAGKRGGASRLTSMMPGKVVRVLVKTGDTVSEGQDVLVVEAMKMENAVSSPAAGRVLELKVEPGDTVETGAHLATIG
jgi:biotin carboxyl carrier protein